MEKSPRRNSSKLESNANLNRVYLVRKEPKYVRSQSNFWSGQTYYIYIILLGNTSFSIPRSFRFALDLSGGFYILQLTLFTLLLVLPIMYMETFLGKYIRLANSQMYRMAPIFFGFCVLVVLIGALHNPYRSTQLSLFLIAALKLLINPDELKKCKDKSEECFDLSDVSKDNVNCTYDHMGFICANKTIKRYVGAYNYWKVYREMSNKNLWQIHVSNVITCIAIILVCILGMKIMGRLLKALFILNFLIYTVIFILAMSSRGSAKALLNMVEFRIRGTINYTEAVMIANYATIRMGLISPVGYMTYAAYTNYKNKLGAGIECIVLSMANLLLNMYFLMVLHSVAGALGAILGLDSNVVYVPSTGLYYAMVPQFLVFKECPITFIILYFLTNWIMAVARLALTLHFVVMNLYDFHPALAKYEIYTKLVTGAINIPLTLVMSQENMVKVFLPHIVIINNNYLQGILLIIKSLMVFYCYGVSRLNDDIHFVTGTRPTKIWRMLWYFYPILISFLLCLTVLGELQNKLGLLPIIEKDLPPLHREALIVSICGLYLLIIFVSSFLYVVLELRASTTFMDLFKPQLYWGPREKKSRLARKAFAPRTSIRSQPPKKKKQRFRTRSIKQMHERDIAERVTRGRIFLDAVVFKHAETETILSREFTTRCDNSISK